MKKKNCNPPLSVSTTSYLRKYKREKVTQLDLHKKICQFRETKYRWKSVLAIALDIIDTDFEVLQDRSRKRSLVEKRQFVMHALHIHGKLTMVQTGDMFGYNHATVIHAVRQINNHIDLQISPMIDWALELHDKLIDAGLFNTPKEAEL